MKSATVAGIVLIIIGIFAFAYQGITFTTQKKVVDIGPIHATKDEKHTVPLTPVLGGLLVVGGVILVLSGSRSIHS
jgi:UDP-N-acetylmuramyl pentapeptide phosphotransferase/UDP-N-acetylglucosamine-1-phosphate transferase